MKNNPYNIKVYPYYFACGHMIYQSKGNISIYNRYYFDDNTFKLYGYYINKIKKDENKSYGYPNR